jgi:hypothetical protein
VRGIERNTALGHRRDILAGPSRMLLASLFCTPFFCVLCWGAVMAEWGQGGGRWGEVDAGVCFFLVQGLRIPGHKIVAGCTLWRISFIFALGGGMGSWREWES